MAPDGSAARVTAMAGGGNDERVAGEAEEREAAGEAEGREAEAGEGHMSVDSTHFVYMLINAAKVLSLMHVLSP